MLRLSCLLSLVLVAPAYSEPPKTVAETSDFKATSRYADVVAYCEELAKQSKLVRLGSIGKSEEGRSLPLLILADPPVASPEEAAKSGKLVVLAFANIHAGEVDGKEAVLMLARDLALEKDAPLLKNLILLFVPIFNADGNEKIDKANRREQAGPEGGVGVRANAKGYDLNRDFVKLETPEVRSLVATIHKWDPAVIVDMHTTNGSYHRFELTYDCPRHPNADADLVTTIRDKWMPAIDKTMDHNHGFKTFFYGNFTDGHKAWESYECYPRYGIQYFALRNRVGILSESYSYASFKTRVLASYGFLKSVIGLASLNDADLKKRLRGASQLRDRLELRTKFVALPGERKVLGYVEEKVDGRTRPTKETAEYLIPCYQGVESTLTVKRPYAYLFPANFKAACENLQRHGIAVYALTEEATLEVEVSKVESLSRQERLFQKHALVSIGVTKRSEKRKFPAGTLAVVTEQPLGNLAGYLLEAEAEDGLATWNFFDEGLKEKGDFPVVRSNAKPELKLAPIPELKE